MNAVADEQWVIRDDVPVYSAHTVVRVDPETKTVTKEEVTRDRLQEIAEKRNRKIAETGNDSLLIIGHTMPGLSEWEQAKRAPTVGFADNYRVKAHPRTGIPTLYARHKYYPESKVGDETLSAQEVIRRFPRRSAEIWLADNDLDAVSLLGPTTPALDLDLLRMARDANPGITLEAPMEPKTGGVQELAMALMQVLEPYLSGGQPPAAEAPPPAAPAETPAQYSRATAQVVQPEVFTAAERQKMQAQIDALQAKLAEGDTRAKYSKQFITLRDDGVDCDPDAETDRVMAMPTDALRDGHVEVVKTHYSRSGVGGTVIRSAAPTENGDYPYRNEIMAKVRANPGMTPDEAKDQIMSRK